MTLVFCHCPPYRAWQGGEARLHNRTCTVSIDFYMYWHLTRYFSLFICRSITSGHSHTQPQTASAAATGADPVTWIYATFPISGFSSLKESGNQKKLCRGEIHTSNVMYIDICLVFV